MRPYYDRLTPHQQEQAKETAYAYSSRYVLGVFRDLVGYAGQMRSPCFNFGDVVTLYADIFVMIAALEIQAGVHIPRT